MRTKKKIVVRCSWKKLQLSLDQHLNRQGSMKYELFLYRSIRIRGSKVRNRTEPFIIPLKRLQLKMHQMLVSWLKHISTLARIRLFQTQKDYFHFTMLKLLKFSQLWHGHQVGSWDKGWEGFRNLHFQSNQDLFCWLWQDQMLLRLRKFNLFGNTFKIQFHWMFFIAIQSQTQAGFPNTSKSRFYLPSQSVVLIDQRMSIVLKTLPSRRCCCKSSWR